MAARKTTKKGARKGATKKATRKGAAKKVARKASAKKIVRKAATKKATRKTAAAKRTRTVVAKKTARKTTPIKRPRNPLATAIAMHTSAQKNLVAAAKAYDRAVFAEARAAEKLSAVKEKIALKSMKGEKSELSELEQSQPEFDTVEYPQSALLIIEADIVETEVFELPPAEELEL